MHVKLASAEVFEIVQLDVHEDQERLLATFKVPKRQTEKLRTEFVRRTYKIMQSIIFLAI